MVATSSGVLCASCGEGISHTIGEGEGCYRVLFMSKSVGRVGGSCWRHIAQIIYRMLKKLIFDEHFIVFICCMLTFYVFRF